MKTTRLGCISSTGIIATLLALLVIGGIAYARGGVLFNPGDLNGQTGARSLDGVASHAETGGRCTACHAAFWQREKMADRCLSCHVDLKTSADNFHRVMLAQSQTWECFSCHTDHNGSQASMTVMDMERFPHQSVGFSLQGHRLNTTGAGFTCSDCHGDDITRFDQAACADCHRQINIPFIDEHLNAFGQGCLACHDGIDTYGKNFDHNRLAFPLQGKHAAEACSSCHSEARTPDDLKGTPQDCASCHADDDAHQGRFGQDCQGCHTPDSWEDASFDHSLAAFPLTGAHTQIECEACHKEGVFKGTPHECAACHAEPAYHAGLFGVDCAACHTTDAWSPARFDRAHTFPFNHGESGPSECRVCHPDALTSYTCYTCHEHNPAEIESKHREEGISDFADCARCHSTGQKEEGEGGEGGG